MAAQTQKSSQQKEEARKRNIILFQLQTALQKCRKKNISLKNACYSVTKYYLCKQNNKRSFFSRKQRHKAFRSFPNRYLFCYTNKVTSLFSIRYVLRIILHCKRACFAMQNRLFCFLESLRELSICYVLTIQSCYDTMLSSMLLL